MTHIRRSLLYYYTATGTIAVHYTIWQHIYKINVYPTKPKAGTVCIYNQGCDQRMRLGAAKAESNNPFLYISIEFTTGKYCAWD